MFDKSDPRAGLSGRTPATPANEAVAAPHYTEFVGEPSQTSPGGSRTWITRGQNFVVAVSRLMAGDELRRPADQGEHVVILHEDGATITVHAGNGSIVANGQCIVVVPPGESFICSDRDVEVVRVFDARTEDLADLAANSADYVLDHPRVAPLDQWPEPVDGDRLRLYPMDDFGAEPGRFGRIFRTRSLMINYMFPTEGPRDISKLSPHHHDDFEQGSLAVRGNFTHHIRTPWTPDMNQWREDEHVPVGSPSLAIIPPPTVHTTRSTGPGSNILIDIFSPPREDFSDQPGWVLNAAEYPRKEHRSSASQR